MNESQTPDFDSIRQVNEQGVESWSARELGPLLGYTSSWQNFELAIKRAKAACLQVGQALENHFNDAIKMVVLGSGAKRRVKDYLLSRFACYLIALNGDPRKSEIAEAQIYFVSAARENELYKLVEHQNQRLELHEQLSEGNRALAQAALEAGVLPRNFGQFNRAGFEGLYGGLGPDELKLLKGVGPKEDLQDRMGREELADNYFRVVQTEGKLRRENVTGQSKAIEAHREIGSKVRGLLEEIGGTLPESLEPETSIRPLLKTKRRQRRALTPNQKEGPKDKS